MWYSHALITVYPQYGGYVNNAPVRRTQTTNIYVFLMTYRTRTSDWQSINFILSRKKETICRTYSRQIEFNSLRNVKLLRQREKNSIAVTKNYEIMKKYSITINYSIIAINHPRQSRSFMPDVKLDS